MADEKSDSDSSPVSSRKCRGISLWGWPLAVLLVTFLLDMGTKLLVVSQVQLGTFHEVIPHFLNLTHLRNSGGAWSILSDYTWLLTMVSVLAFFAMVIGFRVWNQGSKLLAFTSAMLIGGIAGNMVDRIFRGNVVDFIDCYIGNNHWPAFNVADSAICVSIALILFSSLFQKENSRKP